MPKGIPKKGINNGWFKKGVIPSFNTLFKKGQKAWNTGMKMGDEHRKKLSYAHKGLPNPNKGKKFPFKERPNAKGRVISPETRRKISLANKGENSYLWKGGITPENNKIRTSMEMRAWKRACFERDNFTCAKYGVRTGGLVVHHIHNFADFPELRFAIDNGITLSVKAHKEFHKIYGSHFNNKAQLEEFLNNK